eukprot:TRINITY_DN1464_c0_g1_i1.p1 TRINITY_DN1464_c0_g1~~TRINITY_DN1464_c0_g1_i1.p1  ORF type:complete len:416 (+),score=79.82 TRINITY_DN1464_c0_g1_i1:78-1250(+)
MGYEDISSTSSLGKYWYVGVMLSLLGALFSTFGYMLQRWSHQRNDALPPERRLPPFRQWPNIIGVIFLGLEAVFEALSLDFAAESLIASLASVAVVLNLVLAPRLLGEKMQPGDLVITALVILGTSMCVLFSSHGEDEYTWDDLYSKFFQHQFVLYFMMILTASSLLLAFASQSHLRCKSFIKILSADSYVWSPEFSARAKRVALPTIAAVCAGFMSMLGKATVELIQDTMEGDNEFLHPTAWLVPLASLTFLYFQIRFLNESLRIYSALSIVPFYETMNSIFGILNGAVYYRDFDQFSATQGVLFSIGILINVAALVMLMRRPVVGGASPDQEMELAGSQSRRESSIIKYSISEEDEPDDLSTPRELQDEEEQLVSSPGTLSTVIPVRN